MQKKHRLVLWIALGGIAFFAISAALGAVLLGGVLQRKPLDPLMREEVEEELARLPMKRTEFHDRVRSKQSYFRDYAAEKEPVVNSVASTERILSLAKGRGRLYFVPGKSERDVAAFSGVISWDGWSGGPQDVHVTGSWRLLIDRDDYVIGYFPEG